VASKSMKKNCAGCGAKAAGKTARFCVKCGKALMTEKGTRPCLSLSRSVPGYYGEPDPRFREMAWKSAYPMTMKGR
jgi:hypothetical protein